ncbi:IPT/TIG domain-containing protein [Bacteroides ovatus]|uniref:IPT/TIG domain-containing protein n=1 Tax=Bacteroides ovatus TaxID=28116 RepID=UPI003144D7E1
MRKIYYLLLMLPMMLIFSCEEDGNEVVNMKNQDPQVAVTGISPEQGYAGDQFTIDVTDFGGAKDFIKVFIGDYQTKVISCSDTKIVVEVPEDATGGKIKVDFFDKVFATDFVYKVLGKPFIESMNRNWGFIDDEITFQGSSLGTQAADIQLVFGQSTTKAKVVSWSDEEFTVKVPAGATSGKIVLNISTQKNVNVPSEFTVREHATLTEMAPVTAYKGSVVTINGTNLGTILEGTAVFFGDKPGDIVSCSEEKIEVKVPMEAAEGTVEVTVKTFYEEINEKLSFKVIPTPVVDDSGISALEGYNGSIITITGTKMPVNTDNMIVKFGDYEVPVKSYEETDGAGVLTVVVPETVSGTVKLTLMIAGLEICSKDFKVIPAPTVDIFENKLVRTEVIITGTGFPGKVEDVEVKFAGTVVHPTTISSDKMVVQVPEDFASGKLTIAFKDIPVEKEVGYLQVLSTGDVTVLILKNSVQPFTPTSEYVSGEWAMPEGWMTDNYAGQALLFPNGDISQGLFTMQAGYGQPNKQDSKIYQVVTLPKGTYKFTLNVAECGSNKGRFGVFFAVTKGNGTLPNLGDRVSGHMYEWWPLDESNFFVADGSDNKSLYRITDNKNPHQKDLTVILDEETEVTIGFVTQLNQEGWVKLSSINVTLE